MTPLGVKELFINENAAGIAPLSNNFFPLPRVSG
jgi:hypothetical protein